MKRTEKYKILHFLCDFSDVQLKIMGIIPNDFYNAVI